MDNLVIFDSFIEDIDKIAAQHKADAVDLFPLTDDWRLIRSAKSRFEREGRQVTVLNTAQLIDREVGLLREKLIPWSAALGQRVLAGKSLIDWFLIPHEKVSTWWFSLLSEKNPLKTDAFLRLAQTHALATVLRSKKYGACFVFLDHPILKQVVAAECQKASLSPKPPISVNQPGFAESLLRGIAWLARFAFKGIKARKTMAPLSRRKANREGVLFISYFPAFDRKQAEKGIFKNRYALPLQNFLAEKKQHVNWLLMSVPFEDLTYRDALAYGKSFSDHGESVYFIEEFLSWKALSHCLSLWLRQILKCLFLSLKMPKGFMAEGLTTVEGELFLKKLWYDSFIGYAGIGGITYLEVYKEALRFFSETTTCIYYLEMQAWEKALNAARREHPQLKTIGFQHSAFSQNHFSYYYDPSEIHPKSTAADLPLPSILGCNGDVPFKNFTGQGYSSVRRLEAIRHFYLQNTLTQERPIKPKPPVILWVGAYDRKEASSSLLLLQEAFPEPEGFEVWLKPHPGLALELILKDAGIAKRDLKYRIQSAAMNDLLPAVTTVIVGESSVAVDALGCGIL